MGAPLEEEALLGLEVGEAQAVATKGRLEKDEARDLDAHGGKL